MPGHIPECEFGNDPNHRKKMLTGDLLAIVKSTVDKKATMTKMDATRIGKNFGYMIRSLPRNPPSRYLDMSKAVLEHHFDNHEYCGDWCLRKKQSDDERADKDRYY